MSDVLVLSERCLRLSRRQVDALMTAVLLPVMLMVLRRAVRRCDPDPGKYVTYVVPGVIVLCTGFGSARRPSASARTHAAASSTASAPWTSTGRRASSAATSSRASFATPFRSCCYRASRAGPRLPAGRRRGPLGRGGRDPVRLRRCRLVARRRDRPARELPRRPSRDVPVHVPALSGQQRLRARPHHAALVRDSHSTSPSRRSRRRSVAFARNPGRLQRLDRARMVRRHPRRLRRSRRRALRTPQRVTGVPGVRIAVPAKARVPYGPGRAAPPRFWGRKQHDRGAPSEHGAAVPFLDRTAPGPVGRVLFSAPAMPATTGRGASS